MKNVLLLSMAIAAPVFAGAPSVAPSAAPSPTLCEWFVGGTFGQLNNVGTNLSTAQLNLLAGTLVPTNGTLDNARYDRPDFNVYTLQVGRSLSNANGWDLAAYMEAGWLDGSMDIKGSGTIAVPGLPAWSATERVNIDIIPVTLDFKVEHAIYGPVEAYLTGGAGYAWTKVSGFGSTTHDGGFYGQVSAGLIYNVCEEFELFAGARWYYLSHVNLGDTTGELNNEKIGWEIGARYNF